MKIALIQIIILILCLVDIMATYNYINTFHKKFPTIDYKTLEANPILRTSWKIWGLKLGSLIGGVIVFTLVLFLIFTISKEWQYFFSGVFAMMIIYHMLNWQQLMRM